MRPAHRDNLERIARTRPATAGSGAICEAWDPSATEEKERTLGLRRRNHEEFDELRAALAAARGENPGLRRRLSTRES
jgi:hypothetical protein